jgi:hypothetical protein
LGSEVNTLDQKVSEYLEKQKPLQKEIMQKIQAIFLETLPNSEEQRLGVLPLIQWEILQCSNEESRSCRFCNHWI